MKIIGAVMLIFSTTAAGFAVCERERIKLEICSELLQLCDLLSLDISFRKTPLPELIGGLSFKRLDFLTIDGIKEKREISTPLKSEENAVITNFLFSLGKSDTAGQLMLVEGFKEYVKQMQKKYSVLYAKNSKLYIGFGFFGGAILSIIMI